MKQSLEHWTRCAGVGCMTRAVTYLGQAVPLCAEHVRAVRADLEDRALLPPLPKRGRSIKDTTRPALVYYGVTGDQVKIGHTTSPARRWHRLRAELGELRIVAAEPGGADVEYRRHAEFHAARSGVTELFEFGGLLRAHVDALVAARPQWWEELVLPVHDASPDLRRPPLRVA